MEVSKITSTAMRDWMWRTANTLELWERRAISLLDAVALKK